MSANARTFFTPFRLELIGLAFLAIAPLLPYFFFILWNGVPRYSLFSDFALIEHEARHVWSGDTSLGLGSRFGWHHPGPLFFYFVAPFVKLFGISSTGLFVGTCVLSALSAAIPVVAMRLSVGRAHAIATLVVIVAWLLAFGNVAANPWNRTVIVLPLVAYFLLIALVAKGSSASAIPAVFFGAIVIETHISTVTTVGVCGVLAVIAFAIQKRRARDLVRADWKRMGGAIAFLLAVIAPMIIEELTHRNGNISRLLTFLRMREEPFKSWPVAIKDWALATSWFPDRIFDWRVASEEAIPMMLRWDPAPIGLSWTARVILVVFFASTVIAIRAAWRKKDIASLSLIATGIIGSLLAISAIRAIAGDEHYSLLFWAAAPSAAIWAGIFSSLSEGLQTRLTSVKATRATFAALAAFALLAAIAQRSWLSKNPNALYHGVETQKSLQEILSAVKARAVAEGSTPVIHLFGAWPIATASALELEKDGVDVRYSDADAWSFAGAKTSAGLAKSMHLYFDTPQDPLLIAKCTDLIARSGAIAVFASPVDRWTCP